MPNQKPKLSPVAKAGIQELRLNYGIEPTLDEIIWLHELGKAQETAGHSDGTIEAPAKAGKAFLWPMTISAAQWYRNSALIWFHSSPLFVFYALAFALAHGRGDPVPDTKERGWYERLYRKLHGIQETLTLSDLIDRSEAAKSIRIWISATGATRKELETAVNYLLPSDDTDEKDLTNAPWIPPPGISYDHEINELCILTGTEPDYWRTKSSLDATIRMYITAKANENARQGREGPSASDALGEAIRSFRKAMVAIIEAHKGEDEKAEETN